MNNNRSSYKWMSVVAVGLLTAALAGCGSSSSGGGDEVAGPTPPPPASTTITAAAAIAANDTAVNPTAAFTVVQNSGVPAVTVNSAPKVNFTVISDGAVVKDLTTSNVSFIIAKLVPGTNGAPDQWVSYTTRTETATAGIGPNGAPALASAVQATTDTKTATQLVYNNAGYYTYTFSSDVTQNAAYDPSKTHRVAIQLSYTNKAGKTVLVNPYFDFTLSGGNAVAVTDASKTRKVVDISTCNECHSTLALHGGGRVDTQYCVLCHNAGTTDANSGNVVDFRIMVHKIHAGEHVKEWFGKGYTIWGFNNSKHDYAEVTYPRPIADCTKCHDGSKKDASGKQLAAQGDNWKKVPTRAACGSCHAGIDFATGKGVRIEDAEKALEAEAETPGSGAAIRAASYGHIGGAKADDSQCVLCHGVADIPTYHVTIDPKLSAANFRAFYKGKAIPVASQLNLPAGVFKINLEIKQVTVTGAAGAKKINVTYRILKDGSPVTLNPTGFLINNVDQSPSIAVAYAIPQDGIAAPADWNYVYTVGGGATVMDIRDKKSGHSQTGPDASGYYTATLGITIPDDAKMVTAALGVTYAGFVQLGHPSYPDGISLREPKFPVKTADGYTPRRAIVDGDKCNNCHGQLGILPTFHGGARNNGEGCAFCHDPNRATGHIGASNSFGGGWSVAIKNLVHGIHGASKRTQAFSYEATAENPGGFQKVTYPGVLKNCEQCHVAGSYDFSAAANAAAVSNLLWFTDAKGNMTNAASAPYIGLSPWVTTLGKGQIDYTSDNLVSSPIASSCFGCHDSTKAVTHMTGNGGTLVSLFSSVASVATRPDVGAASTMTFVKKELCMDCHQPASTYGLGIKAVHAK